MNRKRYCWAQFHWQCPKHTYSSICIRSFHTFFPSFPLCGFWASHQSLAVWTFSLILHLAGAALKGPKRKQAHTVSLNPTDTTIYQALRAPGRDCPMLIWPTGQLQDPNNHIIEVGALSTGWNFRYSLWVQWGQRGSEKTTDELTTAAVQAALEVQHHSHEAEAAKDPVHPPESLLLTLSNQGQVSQAKHLSWRRRWEKPASTAFEIMKALTSCLCSSCELYCQAGSSTRADIFLVVSL